MGSTIASRLAKIDIKTVEDIIYHFPFRYENFESGIKIDNLKTGQLVNISGFIELINTKRARRKKMSITEALVSNDSGQIKIIWFNQPYISKNLKAGDFVSLSGKVESDYSGAVMKSPNYEKIKNATPKNDQEIIPVYPLTANITQKQIRFLINQLKPVIKAISDWLPSDIARKYGLLSLSEAIYKIHFPEKQSEIEPARRRLSFNELFLMQLNSKIIKSGNTESKAEKINFKEKETKNFVNSLPFAPTNAQKKCSWEILLDMQKPKPMSRMLEGDVGSGKTLVAAIAILNAALNGLQSVLMAPTEILASQHFQSMKKLYKEENVNIALFTRSDKLLNNNKKQYKKEEMIELIKSGNVDLIIGTHALIQESVSYKNLALSIVDEQHRFGVKQRKELTLKSGNTETSPHLLSMTATPIPRSLALVLYGDLDVSIIDELPAGRKKIQTNIIPNSKRDDMYSFLRKNIEASRQVFIICPLIDISDKLGSKSVREEYDMLSKNIFPDIKMEMLHGKLKAAEKERIMKRFLQNKTKILISTSVIEVGVDVPNANIMLIEGADRFGLAQLHQFRGRVGRGEHQSYCFLCTDNRSQKTIERLKALVKSENGFDLAKMDLEMRGPGEVYGTSQKGFPEMKMATLLDHKAIAETNEAAKYFHSNNNLADFPLLNEKIKNTQKDIHME